MAESLALLYKLITVVEIAIGIGFIIFIHELGHFLVAKKFGVRVERFSIGFGPRVVSFTRGETEYLICLFPLGGYVKMAGEATEEVSSGAPDEFLSKAPRQRFAIFVAGPFMNYVVGFPLLVLAFLSGVRTLDPVVSKVIPGSPAWEAGIEPGDRILKANGGRISYFKQLRIFTELNKGKEVTFTIADGTERTVRAILDKELGLGVIPLTIRRSISQVLHDTPAERAGLRAGDEIVAVDGVPVLDWGEMSSEIHRSAGRTVRLTVKRGSELLNFELVPEAKKPEVWLYSFGMRLRHSPVVGFVKSQTPLRPNDRIVSIDGKKITNWWDFIRELVPKQTAEVLVERAGSEKSLSVRGGYECRQRFAPSVDEPLVVTEVEPSGPADGAGIRVGDRLVEFGEPKQKDHYLKLLRYTPPDALMEALARRYKGKGMRFVFERGERFETILSAVKVKAGLVGIVGETSARRHNLIESLILGFEETIENTTLLFKVLKGLLTREIPVTTLSGPVGIITASYQSARGGVEYFLNLLGLLTINFAILNLLPIPVLDGGHILFLAIEAVRRKPLSKSAQMVLVYFGLALLVTLLLVATFGDISRLR